MQDLALEPVAWLVGALLIVGCWPLAQGMKHPDQSPLAAFLLFASLLALAGAAVFRGLVWLVALAGFDAGPVTGTAIMLAALLAGTLAGRWIVRRPPRRRMPR